MDAVQAVKAGYRYPPMVEHGTYVCSCGRVIGKCACKRAGTERHELKEACHECWQKKREA
jgi:hypothetical protein